MQCSGSLGVSLIVHIGNPVGGGKEPRLHSKHPVLKGRMTLAWPLNPSVPPSIIALCVEGSGLPSSSNLTIECNIEFIHLLASMLSKPAMTIKLFVKGGTITLDRLGISSDFYSWSPIHYKFSCLTYIGKHHAS